MREQFLHLVVPFLSEVGQQLLLDLGCLVPSCTAVGLKGQGQKLPKALQRLAQPSLQHAAHINQASRVRLAGELPASGRPERCAHDIESRCRIQGVQVCPSSAEAAAWQMMTRLQCRWSWMGRNRKSLLKMSTP